MGSRTPGTVRYLNDFVDRSRQANPTVGPSIEALRRSISAGMCPFCPRGPFIVLAGHTEKTHGIGSRSLKEMANYPMRTSICDPEYAARASTVAIARDLQVLGNESLSYETRRRNSLIALGSPAFKLAFPKRPCVVCGVEIRGSRKVCSKACFRLRRADVARSQRKYAISCAIAGCPRPQKSHGLCHTHDAYERRHGDGSHPDRSKRLG